MGLVNVINSRVHFSTYNLGLGQKHGIEYFFFSIFEGDMNNISNVYIKWSAINKHTAINSSLKNIKLSILGHQYSYLPILTEQHIQKCINNHSLKIGIEACYDP